MGNTFFRISNKFLYIFSLSYKNTAVKLDYNMGLFVYISSTLRLHFIKYLEYLYLLIYFMVFTKTSLRIPKLRINLSCQFHPVF